MSRLPRKVAAAGLRCLAHRVPRSVVQLLEEDAHLVRHFEGVPDARRVDVRENGRRSSRCFTLKAIPRYYATACAAVHPSENGFVADWQAAALLQEDPQQDSQEDPVSLEDDHGLSDVECLQAEESSDKPEIDGGLGDCKYPQTARVQERVQFLRELGLSEEDLTTLQLRSKTSLRSALLQISLKKLTNTVSFLTEEVGLSKAQAGRCLFDDFYLGSSSVDVSLRPKVLYFRQLGFSDEQMVKLVCKRPQILTCHMERTIVPMTRKLVEIGLKDDDIIKVYLKSPGFIRTGMEKIDHIVEFMHGFGVKDITKVFRTTPKIFDLSLDGKVSQTTNFFKHHLELDAMQMNRVFKWTQVFNYSVENNLRVKTDYFQSLGLPKEDVARMVAMFPCMLGLNMEVSIKPKVDYLIVVLKKNVGELVYFPMYLSYSLKKRIQPRYEYAMAMGCDFRLSYFLSCGEGEFVRRVNNRASKMKLREEDERSNKSVSSEGLLMPEDI